MTGPHVYLGEGLAHMELAHFLVTLLHRYQFVWPKDAREPGINLVWGVKKSDKRRDRLNGGKTAGRSHVRLD